MRSGYFYLFIVGFLAAQSVLSQSKPISSIKGELENLQGVNSVVTLKCDTFFLEKYLVKIDQPVDHRKKSGPSFSQRVYIGFKGRNKPTVFVTEGYGGAYAAWPKYLNELCPILDANLVFVEHRYFGESIPDTGNWKYHTIEQSANDHHRINQLMKQIFSGKFVSTGISKGGQTTMYYKYYFPEDVDVWIPYVAPLNFSIADNRVNPFINNIDGEDCRKKIVAFQKLALYRQDRLMADFNKLAKTEGYHYNTIGGNEAGFEYIVLEYPFAFWQWGFIPCKDIPTNSDHDSTVLRHLLEVSPLDYFTDEGMRDMWPFFYQALTQIGYYDYDTTGLGNQLDYVTDLTFSPFAPPGTNLKFKKKYMKNVDEFLRTKGDNMICLYGEYDPWSSTAFVPEAGKTNALKVVKKRGSHTTQINNLPEHQRNQVLDSLELWLNVKTNR
nr:peptidase [Bacteroidota bacterium]